MSNVGNNIKKIRGIKGLNQNDFASIFNLKRASIGAYEEGRAEPKLATIIEIANYFSISIDELVQKELSVNDFYKFDLFREDLIKGSKHNLNPTILPIDLVSVPLITTQQISAYCQDVAIENTLQTLTIPLQKGKDYMAFEVEGNAMLHESTGVASGDIIIARKNQKLSLNNVTVGMSYVFMIGDNLIYRQLAHKSLSFITLHAWNPGIYDQQIDPKEILEIWEVEKLITNSISRPVDNNQRISLLESEILTIREQLKKNG